MKFRLLSRRCETCPAKGEPARAGSEPGDGLGNEAGEAQARERVGRGDMASKAMSFRMPSVLFCVKAMTISPWIFSKRSRGEEGSGPAGCCTTARTKRMAS